MLDQLGEILRARFPFGVGVAAPGADAETGGVDKDPVEGLGVALDPGVALGRERAALDIAEPGAAQALAGAVEPPLRGVAGDELAAVVHRRRQCKRLAAGAGAEIDDAHPRPRIGEDRGELRRLVLHLDESVLEHGEPGDRGPRLEAEAERGIARLLGVDSGGGQLAERGVAVGLDRVDAEVHRRRAVERRHLVLETVAIDRREPRFEPVGQIVGDRARHRRVVQSAAGEAFRQGLLGRGEDRRAKAAAIEAVSDPVGRAPFTEG